RRFVVGLFQGEIRQGALAGVMVEAVARAGGAPAADIRRAAMLAGNLATVAAAALGEGPAGLARFTMTVLSPVSSMLAQTAEDPADAMERIHPASVEWKLDGARIQVHRQDDEVRAFTRNLADMTGRVPALVAMVGALPLRSVILDGEAIAIRRDRRPEAFQVTMSRFGSRVGVEELRRQMPLSPFFFDCLHLEGEDLIDRPQDERF